MDSNIVILRRIEYSPQADNITVQFKAMCYLYIVNMRKILLLEAKLKLTVFTRMLTICTVTLEAMQYLFYYTEQNYKFIQFILYLFGGGEHG